MKAMTLNDLAPEIREQLVEKRTKLHTEWKVNTPYRVLFTNEEGTRYFEAVRTQDAWCDSKGNYMPFGGGSSWQISYGKILWSCTNDRLLGARYEWVRTKQIFGKSANGTEIPKKVKSKKEVIEIAKAIGTLDM